MRTLVLATSAALFLAACGPGSSRGEAGASGGASADCPLAAQWHATGPEGEYGTFLVAPDGQMAWANLGLGEGSSELDGRNLHIRFQAPAHQFQVDVELDDACEGGEGTIDIRQFSGGQTGTFPISLRRNGDQDAWRDHYALQDAVEGG